MTRMNILVAVLCLVMGRPYQFYYFVPLVSFWFVVIYLFVAAWPRVTAAFVKGEKIWFFDQALGAKKIGLMLILFSPLN